MNKNNYKNEFFFEDYSGLKENLFYIEERTAIFSLCNHLEGKAVLDINCGNGENCVILSNMGAERVVGLNTSKKMLSSANAMNKNEKISFLHLDLEDIDMLEDKFDIIFSSMAVQYVNDFRSFLKNINKLLSYDGYFIFSQDHPLSTAPISGVHWTRDENQNILHYDLSDYRRDGERIVSFIVEGITKYHRCFSEIVNTIVEEGFTIECMLEPVPSKEAMGKLPYYEKSMHKPNFLIVKIKKVKNLD